MPDPLLPLLYVHVKAKSEFVPQVSLLFQEGAQAANVVAHPLELLDIPQRLGQIQLQMFGQLPVEPLAHVDGELPPGPVERIGEGAGVGRDHLKGGTIETVGKRVKLARLKGALPGAVGEMDHQIGNGALSVDDFQVQLDVYLDRPQILTVLGELQPGIDNGLRHVLQELVPHGPPAVVVREWMLRDDV